MPVSKNQERRLRILNGMLHARGNTRVSYSTFLEKMKDNELDDGYHLSSKTFNRDIAVLRDEYHAPLQYDKRRHNWYLTDLSWQPDVFWGKFDASKAILSARIASSLLPRKMQSLLQDALGGLLTNNSGKNGKYMDLESFQILSSGGYFVDGNIFLAAYQAWEKRETIVLTYRDSKGICKEKLFEPHIFAWHNNTWYLKGKLLENRTSISVAIKNPPEVQVLALHRISEIRGTGKFYKKDAKLLKELKETGLFEFKRIPAVEMEFYGRAARTNAERFEKRPEVIVAREADMLRIRLRNIAEYEAISLAMAAIGEVRVIAPESLKKSIREIAQKLLDNHS